MKPRNWGRIRRTISDALLRQVARAAASPIVESIEIAYGIEDPNALSIRYVFSPEGWDRLGPLVLDTRQMVGLVESVRAPGWTVDPRVVGRPAFKAGAVVLERGRSTVASSSDLVMVLDVSEPCGFDLLPLPQRLPRVMRRGDPLTSYTRDSPPFTVAVGEAGGFGGIWHDGRMLGGWLRPDAVLVLDQGQRVTFYMAARTLEALPPFARHNAARHLSGIRAAFEGVVYPREPIDILVAEPASPVDWTEPTLSVPVLPYWRELISPTGELSIPASAVLWRLARAAWGGACRVSGRFGQAVEVAVAAAVVDAGLNAMAECRDSQPFRRRIARLGARGGRLANRLAAQLMHAEAAAVVPLLAELTGSAWGRTFPYDDLRIKFADLGLTLPAE